MASYSVSATLIQSPVCMVSLVSLPIRLVPSFCSLVNSLNTDVSPLNAEQHAQRLATRHKTGKLAVYPVILALAV